jgi:hypothetical protein
MYVGVTPANAASAAVTITNEVVGKTPLHIGYGQGHYIPGSNTSAWVDYSGVNAYRIWTAMSNYEPVDDMAPYGDGVTDITSFDTHKAALRSNPESTAYINWPVLNDRFENYTTDGTNKSKLNYMLGELNNLGISVLAVMNPVRWTGSQTWADRWELWQYDYALAYHMAKNYDVQVFEIFNEPDHGANINMTQDTYIEMLRFSSDAIRSAVADVNSLYGKALSAQISAPVLTHAQSSTGDYHMVADPDSDPRDDQYGWGQKAMMNIRKDYHGNTVNYDIFNIFGTHKYGSTGSDFYNEIEMIKTKMVQFSPTATALPIYYTEFNRYSTGQFDENANYNLSSMGTVTDMAFIYAKSMLRGVKGMLAFKFSNTYTDAHGYQGTGFHYVWDAAPYLIGGVTRSGEVVRLMAKGFKDERDRYKTMSTSANNDYGAYTSYDPITGNYYILAINPNTSADYTVSFNMSGLGVNTDSVISVEEISEDHWGEVTQITKMPSSKSFTLTHPKQSVWLITVPKGAVLTENKLVAAADAQVQSGASANTNFGSDISMRVKKDSGSANNDRVSYLKFNTAGINLSQVKRAILRVNGRNPIDGVDMSVHAYGISNDSWNESTITWNNAPNLDPSSPKITGVGSTAFPVGHLSFDSVSQIVRMDVTDYVKNHPDSTLSFALIRESRYANDNSDDGRHAIIDTREAASGRPYLELWY